MNKTKLYTCVYCLQDKPTLDFNKEHVAPKSFGTYQNSMTLHENQVCKQCNDTFSKELENEIADDSFEALLRITNNVKKLSPGHKIKDMRIKLNGQDGILKGLAFRVLADSMTKEKIQLIPYPAIGINISENPVEYKYYEPDDLPYYSEEIANQLQGKAKPILYWSMDKADVETLLVKKGYAWKSHKNVAFTDLYDGEVLNIRIDLIMDKVLNRLVAKTAFNYLVYNEGREYALLPKFNPIRNFIRFGKEHESIVVKHTQGKVENFRDKDSSHIIGLAWGDQYHRKIFGLVSWFNESTHIICLTDNTENIARPLPMSVFDNISKVISTTKQVYVVS
jgi:hypothetical protein